MKNYKLLIILFGLLVIVVRYLTLSPAISAIYQKSYYDPQWGRGECKSTVVLVEHAPITQQQKIGLWNSSKHDILKKWTPLNNNKCDDILFVNNNVEPVIDSMGMKEWMGEEQICLEGKLGARKCISRNERLFYIVRDKPLSNHDIKDTTNGETFYLHFVNN